jgi:predicted nucleic acid-binding protein
MNLDQVPTGAQVFVDSNILVYHFQPHPGFGPMCHRFVERIERQDIEAFTSTNLLGELAHRLMVIEAGTLPGWAGSRVLNRLKQQPATIQQLTLFQTAVETVLQSNIKGVKPAARTASFQLGKWVRTWYSLIPVEAMNSERDGGCPRDWAHFRMLSNTSSRSGMA